MAAEKSALSAEDLTKRLHWVARDSLAVAIGTTCFIGPSLLVIGAAFPLFVAPPALIPTLALGPASLVTAIPITFTAVPITPATAMPAFVLPRISHGGRNWRGQECTREC